MSLVRSKYRRCALPARGCMIEGAESSMEGGGPGTTGEGAPAMGADVPSMSTPLSWAESVNTAGLPGAVGNNSWGWTPRGHSDLYGQAGLDGKYDVATMLSQAAQKAGVSDFDFGDAATKAALGRGEKGWAPGDNPAQIYNAILQATGNPQLAAQAIDQNSGAFAGGAAQGQGADAEITGDWAKSAAERGQNNWQMPAYFLTALAGGAGAGALGGGAEAGAGAGAAGAGEGLVASGAGGLTGSIPAGAAAAGGAAAGGAGLESALAGEFGGEAAGFGSVGAGAAGAGAAAAGAGAGGGGSAGAAAGELPMSGAGGLTGEIPATGLGGGTPAGSLSADEFVASGAGGMTGGFPSSSPVGFGGGSPGYLPSDGIGMSGAGGASGGVGGAGSAASAADPTITQRVLDAIKKNPLTAAGMGLNLAKQFFGKKNTLADQLRANGQPAQDAANSLLAQYKSGSIPASTQFDIDKWKNQQIASARQRYGRMGDSTALRNAISGIEAEANSMTDKARQGLLDSGLKALGVASGPLTNAAMAEANQDQQFSASQSSALQSLMLMQAMSKSGGTP